MIESNLDKKSDRNAAQVAVDALKASNSYNEFKMKLAVIGMDMYNITVLRRLNRVIPPNMRLEFDADVRDNVDKPELENLALTVVTNRLWGELDGTRNATSRFETYIAQMWIDKHEHEYR